MPALEIGRAFNELTAAEKIKSAGIVSKNADKPVAKMQWLEAMAEILNANETLKNS